MAQAESLRTRYEQHKPKNDVSKFEDKTVAQAAMRVIDYLKDRFHSTIFENEIQENVYYDLSYDSSISVEDMIKFITRKGYRKWEDFDHTFDDKTIQPDGGIIYLEKVKISEMCDPVTNETNITTDILEKYPLVIAEVKHQGTNDKRAEEGKSSQASGNAIERLGKNLTGIKAMTHYETITPFICFGDGCDFMLDSETEKIEQLHLDNAKVFADIICSQLEDAFNLYVSDIKNKINKTSMHKLVRNEYREYVKMDDNIKITDATSASPLGLLLERIETHFIQEQNADIVTDISVKEALQKAYLKTIVDRLKNSSRTVRAKVFTLNDFYEINKLIIFKKDKSLDDGPFAPVSMMFRYEPWSENEMYEYMKEIAETSFRYYTM